MSKRPENINFDHFKSQFEEQSNHDFGWNDPPDFVFEEAMTVVNRQKSKKNRKNLFIFFTLLLFGVIVGVLLYSHKKVTLLEDKVNLLTLGSSSSDISNHVLGGSAYDTKSLTATDEHSDVAPYENDEIANVKESVSNSLAYDLIKESKITTATSVENKLFTNSQNSRFPVKEDFDVESKNMSKVFGTSINQLSKFNSDAKAHNINLRSIAKDFITDIEKLRLNIQSLEIERKAIDLNKEISWIETVHKRKAVISFAAIRNLSSLTMNGEFNSPQLLTNYDDFYSGVGYQVALDFPVSSKLRWSNSLAFNRINNESYNVNSSSYLKSNEFIASGSTVYIMDANVESPVGLLSETMAIEVDPLLMNDGDLIEDKVRIGQHLNVFSVASGLQYSLLQNKHIGWYTGVSIGGAYISRLATQMESEIVMRNETMDNFSSTMEGAKDLNSFYSFLELSSGVGYNLGKKYKLNMGLGYSRSLNSLRSNAQGGPSSYLQNWSTTLGISRSF